MSYDIEWSTVLQK